MTRRISVVAFLLYAICAEANAQSSEQRAATKEEYAACLDAGDSIERRKQELARSQENHDAFAKKIQAADASFNEQVKKHPPRSSAELASYNKAIDQRNQVAKEFNERARSLQRTQLDLNALIVETNSTCSTLLVNLEIKDAVESERRSRAQKQ